MKLRKIKKYLGLCQCKGCKKAFSTVTLVFTKHERLYLAYVCEEHAAEALLDPLVRYLNANP